MKLNNIAISAFALTLVLASCTPEDEFITPPVTSVSGLCINEASNETDFIELYNSSQADITLDGYILTDNKGVFNEEAYTFAKGSVIKAGEFLLLTKDDSDESDPVKNFKFGLGSGDEVQFFDTNAKMIGKLSFPAEKDAAIASHGCKVDGDLTQIVAFAVATPGKPNDPNAKPVEPSTPDITPIAGLCVNEASNGDDFIELYNSSDAAISLAGLILSDNNGADDEDAYTFAAGTSIEAGAYLVLTKDDTDTSDPAKNFKFGLGGGDEVQLFSADKKLAGKITFPADKVDGVESYGCKVNGDISEIVAFAVATPGEANDPTAKPAEPTTPDASDIEGLFINEVTANETGPHGQDFIELYNNTDAAIDLAGFRVTKSEDAEDQYTFPAGSTIAAKSFYLLEKEQDNFYISFGNNEDIRLYDKDSALISKVFLVKDKAYEGYGCKVDGDTTTLQHLAVSTPGYTNAIAQATSSELCINEASNDGGSATGEDFIELYNKGTRAISLEGFILADDNGADDADAYVIGDVTLKPGAIALFTKESEFAFGLGTEDEARVYDSSKGLVCSVAFTAKTNSLYLAQDGVGSDYLTREIATPGLTNDVSPMFGKLIINEGSNELDFVEIYNKSGETIDISGYTLSDEGGWSHEEAYTIPAGTSVASMGFKAYFGEDEDGNIIDFVFGFGKGDSAMMFDENHKLVSILTFVGDDKYYSYGYSIDGVGLPESLDTAVETPGNETPGAANAGRPSLCQ